MRLHEIDVKKLTQAVAFSIDTTDVQERLEDLGLEVEVSEIDASRDGGIFTVEGGENETGIILTLRLVEVEHDFDRLVVGAKSAPVADLTSEAALERFRKEWERADAEGDTGNRVRRGIQAIIEGAIQ